MAQIRADEDQKIPNLSADNSVRHTQGAKDNPQMAQIRADEGQNPPIYL